MMKFGGKPTIWLVCGMLSGTAVEAAMPDAAGPYHAILERNVFNIHPPPPPNTTATEKKTDPPPKITLDGTTTILGQKMAILTVANPKPPPETLMLAEGQAQDEVEVTSIDERAGVVKIVNHTEEQTLDFEHNGTKPTATAPGAAPPSPMPFPPIPAPPPVNGSSAAPSNFIRPMRTLQNRSPYGQNSGGSSSGTSSVGGGLGFPAPGSSQQDPNSLASLQNTAGLTEESQTVLIETQRAKLLQSGDTEGASLFPNTEYTGDVNKSFGSPY